jgi:oligopeptide transport system substrate-binding protein
MSRNPNYYDKPLPYFDKQNWFMLTEPAAQLAQFEAKNLDLGSGLTSDNIVDVKRRHAEMVLSSVPVTSVDATTRFGYGQGEPYNDVRVRRAISMAYDRVALEEFFTNKSKLQAQGLPVTPKWTSHIPSMWSISTSPADTKAFGPNSKWFAYDIAEAKKQLAAAGHSDIKVAFHIDNFSQTNVQVGQLLAGQLRDTGITVNETVENNVNWFLPKVYRSQGAFDGLAHGALAANFSPESFLYAYFSGVTGTALYAERVFPDLTSRLTAILKELDDKKRASLLKDFEKLAADQMPSLPLGSSSQPFTLTWPWVGNAGVYQQWPGDQVGARNVIYSRYWLDKAKASELGKTS